MEHYFVTAIIEKNDNADLELTRAELKKLATETVKEKDCLRFEIREIIGKEGMFVMWEEFTSKEALDFHFTLEHTLNFAKQNLTVLKSAEFTRSI
jgi:quinol monooxygenase YgiN